MTLVDLTNKLPVHPTKTYHTRQIESIRWLVLHHAAGPETQTPEQIARFHVDGRDWPGCAYHYLTAPDGTVYKCWPATTATYCVKGGNRLSLCVCMIGNRDLAAPPAAQWEATVDLFKDLRIGYGHLVVLGHREAPTDPPQATACPGRMVDLERFRQEVGT